MAKGINDAIVDFLRRPVTSVLGDEEDESVVDARRTVTAWIVDIAQDPTSRGFLVEKLQVALEGTGARTWGEVLDKMPSDHVDEWLVSGARSEAAETLLRRGGHPPLVEPAGSTHRNARELAPRGIREQAGAGDERPGLGDGSKPRSPRSSSKSTSQAGSNRRSWIFHRRRWKTWCGKSPIRSSASSFGSAIYWAVIIGTALVILNLILS